MIKRAVLLILFSVFYAGCASFSIPPSFKDSGINKDSIVFLFYHSAGRLPYIAGNGFLVGTKGCFITAYHIRASTMHGSLKVHTEFGKFGTVHLDDLPGSDIAIYRADRAIPAVPVRLPVRLYMPSEKEEFLVASKQISPVKVVSAREPFSKFGVVISSEIFLQVIDLDGYQFLGEVKNGQSGSPVFNKMGETIGMLSAESPEKKTIHAISVSQFFLNPILDILGCL